MSTWRKCPTFLLVSGMACRRNIEMSAFPKVQMSAGPYRRREAGHRRTELTRCKMRRSDSDSSKRTSTSGHGVASAL
ncbi:MAG: hypothetical protein RL385_5654, partial [Pseudomonadota bacterium]